MSTNNNEAEGLAVVGADIASKSEVTPAVQVANTAPRVSGSPSLGGTEKKSDFREKLLLMLIEKGILALVFVYIGFAVSKNIEEVRAKQTRANLVADRALKVLDELNQPLAEVYRIIDRVQSTSDRDAKVSAAGDLIQPIRQIKDKLGDAADSTWITPGASHDLTELLTSVSRKNSSAISLQDAHDIRVRVEGLKRQIIEHPVSGS